MLKRNLTMLIAVGLLGANVNLAAAESAFPSSNDDSVYDWLPAQEQYFKQGKAVNPNLQVASGDERTVKTTAATKYLNIEHEALVRIRNDKGQSFVWKADTLGEADLSLQAIAPKDFAAGQTRVFVRHPYEHTIND